MTLNDNITPYERLGGETRVKELVDRFYDNMDSLESVKTTRSLHANSLKGSRRKLFMFLSGWLGGPNLYIEAYGHPRLRMRHMPFSIGSQERDEWMLCMRKALQDMNLDADFREELEKAFLSTADHMRNRNEDPSGLNIVPAADH